MDCNEFKDLISPYIDNEITLEEKAAFERHLKQCADCSSDFDGIRRTVELCRSLPLEDPPENLDRMVLEKIEARRKPGFIQNLPWKAITGLAAMLIAAVIITQTMDWIPKFNLQGLGSQPKSAPQQAATKADESGVEMHDAAAPSLKSEASSPDEVKMMALPEEQAQKERVLGAAGMPEIQQAPVEMSRERKLIKTAQLDVSVEDFDGAFNAITKLAEETGGFVQASGIHNAGNTAESERQGHLRLRVPQHRFTDVVEKIEGMGELKSKNISGDNITKQYYDTQARVAAYKKQEQRLLEILDRAKTVDEILKVENELGRVRYEIETLTGQVKTWDDLVGLSTIDVNIQETRPSKKAIESSGLSGIWAKSSGGFIKTVNMLINAAGVTVVAVITALPVFGVILVLGLIASKLYRRFGRHHG